MLFIVKSLSLKFGYTFRVQLKARILSHLYSRDQVILISIMKIKIIT